MRYNEIRKELGNIIDAVLAAMLKELIADELISREQYNEIPPKVEYALTEEGKSVLPILQSICHWSGSRQKKNWIENSRRAKLVINYLDNTMKINSNL